MAIEVLSDDTQIQVVDTELSGVSNGDPEVSYTVRKLDPETHRKIVKKHTRTEFVRGVGRVKETDTDALTDELLDYVLVAWVGVLLKGEPAPCTKDLKVRGLDWERKRALLEKAGANDIAREPERRAESFRPPA